MLRVFPWQTTLIVLVCAWGVLPYALVERPIWIDEFLHFAFAAFDTTAEAWNAIKRSTSLVNHGQTGIYMLVDYWLLKAFGASVFWLRAPSLFSAFLLCYSASVVLKIRGFGILWQLFAIVIMVFQSELMYFAGEARPYMPLAASVVGTLVYSLATEAQRAKSEIKILGIFSIISGSLLHPYFSIYWALLFAFGLWFRWFNNGHVFTQQAVIRYVNLPLLSIGIAVYFVLAAQTWLTGSPKFDHDPFHYLPWSDFFHLFISKHTIFLGLTQGGVIFLYACLIGLIILILIPHELRKWVRYTLPPMILILIALAVSVLLCLVSYYENYWILPRQWLASIGLVATGFVWLIAELSSAVVQVVPKRTRQFIHLIIFFITFAFCWQINQSHISARWAELTNYLHSPHHHTHDSQVDKTECDTSPDRWVALANANVRSGGLVWPIFKFYYDPHNNPSCVGSTGAGIGTH